MRRQRRKKNNPKRKITSIFMKRAHDRTRLFARIKNVYNNNSGELKLFPPLLNCLLLFFVALNVCVSALVLLQ